MYKNKYKYLLVFCLTAYRDLFHILSKHVHTLRKSAAKNMYSMYSMHSKQTNRNMDPNIMF